MQMIYKDYNGNAQILKEGTYEGYHYLILSLGSHPCAYVELPKNHKYYGLNYDEIPIECHGGLTYSDLEGVIFPKTNENHRDGFWIGWDYAHLGDCYYSMLMPASSSVGKRWTTEEIFKEVKEVIKQLKEV